MSTKFNMTLSWQHSLRQCTQDAKVIKFELKLSKC